MKILFIAAAMLLFYSCAAKEPIIITEYITVKEPIRCDAIKPDRPPQQESVASTINRILMYAEQLESIVDYCTGGAK